MTTKIIVGSIGWNGAECACFLDSVTDTVFGKIMNDLEEAESFQKYVLAQKGKDLRALSNEEFESLLNKFREARGDE